MEVNKWFMTKACCIVHLIIEAVVPGAKVTYIADQQHILMSVKVHCNFGSYSDISVVILGPEKRGDPDKQGDWKIPHDEISGGRGSELAGVGSLG